MSNKFTGWLLFLVMIGAMLTLASQDIKNLATWHEATEPKFVGQMILHIGTVIGAFIGGKITNRDEPPSFDRDPI